MSRRNKSNGTTDGMLLPFRFTLSGTLSSGLSGFVLQPSANFGTRALAEADAWAHFRVRRFAFRLHRGATAASAGCAAGYVGGIQDTPPATFAAVSELLPSTVFSSVTTTPSSWVQVPPKDLAGPFPWYKSIPGAADPTEEAPGQIIIASTASGSDTFLLEMKGVFEFKTAVSTANTPEELRLLQARREIRKARQLEAEQRAMARVLAGTPATGGPTLRVAP